MVHRAEQQNHLAREDSGFLLCIYIHWLSHSDGRRDWRRGIPDTLAGSLAELRTSFLSYVLSRYHYTSTNPVRRYAVRSMRANFPQRHRGHEKEASSNWLKMGRACISSQLCTGRGSEDNTQRRNSGPLSTTGRHQP